MTGGASQKVIVMYSVHAQANGKEVWFDIPGHDPAKAICNAALYLRDTYGDDGEYAILSPLRELSDPADEQEANAAVAE